MSKSTKEEVKKVGAPDTARQKIVEALDNGTIKLYLLQGKTQEYIYNKLGVGCTAWFQYAKEISELSKLLNKYRQSRLVTYLESADKLANGYTKVLHSTISTDRGTTEETREVHYQPNERMLRFLVYNHSRSLEKSERLSDEIIAEVKLKELEIKEKELALKERELQLKEVMLRSTNSADEDFDNKLAEALAKIEAESAKLSNN